MTLHLQSLAQLSDGNGSIFFKGYEILALLAIFDRRLRFQYNLSVERSLSPGDNLDKQ
jgi:hypothetical protein